MNRFKACPDCLKMKTIVDFYPSKHSKSGLRRECKDCSKKQAKDPTSVAKYRNRKNQLQRAAGAFKRWQKKQKPYYC